MNEKIQRADQADVEEILVETLPEAHIRAQNERASQERLDKIQQERKNLADLKQLAEFENTQAELFIEGCKSIFKDNLATGPEAEWAALYNDTPYPPFVFKNPATMYNQVARETGMPPQKENDAKDAYNLMMKHYYQEGNKS